MTNLIVLVILVIDAKQIKLNEQSYFNLIANGINITVYCIYFETRTCFYNIILDTTFSTCLLPVFKDEGKTSTRKSCWIYYLRKHKIAKNLKQLQIMTKRLWNNFCYCLVHGKLNVLLFLYLTYIYVFIHSTIYLRFTLNLN